MQPSSTKLAVVDQEPVEFTYKPTLSSKERRAYHAAHRIMTEELNSPDLISPGARRSYYIDNLARIILECV